jgi:alkylhydroperoxidase family enzyme
MARIEPIPLEAFTPEVQQAFAGLAPPDARYRRPDSQGRPAAANILGTLAHHPELTTAYCVLNGHLLMNTTLSERHREIVILRVGALRESAYEWAQHISLADDAGLTAIEIGCVSFGPNAPVWHEQDKAELQAVDDLLIAGEISDRTWDVLVAHLTTQQILD